MTNTVLLGIERTLHALVTIPPSKVNVRNDKFAEYVQQRVQVCRMQYEVWEASYKLESTNPRFSYNDLPHEIRETDARVKWYFELLTCWLNHIER